MWAVRAVGLISVCFLAFDLMLGAVADMRGASGYIKPFHTWNMLFCSFVSPEFFEASHLHNAIEVGTFENFLPGLYEQRSDLEDLR